MSDIEPVFKGDIGDVESVDLDAPLRIERARVCDYYITSYGKAGKEAEERGDEKASYFYKFLNVLTSFHPDFGDPTTPYRPLWIMDGERSLVPNDLHASDYLVIRELAVRVKDPALRARLYDLLWIEEHNYLDCREAVASYLESAKNLDANDDWTFAVTQYLRGLQLASKMGRNQDSFQAISRELVDAISGTRNSEEGYRTAQFLHVAIEFRCGDPHELAEIAKQIGDRSAEVSDHRKAQSYWELEASLLRGKGNIELAQEAERRAAEALVVDAAERAAGPNGSFLAAASILKEGIEALRRAMGPKERIAELKVRLAEYQRNSRSEMQSFETSVDISKIVEGAIDHVKGRNFLEALQRFTLGPSLIDVDQLREEVIQNAKDFPMQHLFGGSVVDDEGRSTVELPTLFHLEGEAAGTAIEALMFAHAANFIWGIRTSSFIDPARVQILNDHHPSLRTLAFLVRNNPFVPPGHEGVFLRGVHAGFHGDFLVAAHLLIPQIENSIRHILTGNEVDVSNLMSDGTQPVKILGPLFDLEETKAIFGDSLCFELRGLLIQKTGYDFRNRIAHGFVSEGECYGPAAVTLWWLALRLCLTPLLPRAAELATESSPLPESDQSE
jgi:hypothetical protein